MPRWDYNIDLADVFHNDNLPFEEKRDRIVKAIRESVWYQRAGDDSELWDRVEALADTSNTENFDWVWNDIYDLADVDRAWIKTF